MRPGAAALTAVLALAAPFAYAAEPVATACPPSAERRMAVTFDDLPGPPGGLVSNGVEALRADTARLLSAIGAHGIPAIGFVNEGKLVVEGEPPEDAARRTAVLRLWVEAGLELGNHSYSHRSLNRTPLAEFQDDVVRGEPVTRRLLEQSGRRLRYFRHPFLQVGLELDKRRAFEAFLAERGYTVAPVTIDNDEYVYAAVYAAARRSGGLELAAKVAADYLRYMAEVIAFDEDVALRLTGRAIPHVLLLHANTLNAEHFATLAAQIAARGYCFVPLEAALADEVYRLPDDYVGEWGISWLHHWELTAGRKRSPSPDPPAWVTSAYEELQAARAAR